jgi:hypothetical protein
MGPGTLIVGTASILFDTAPAESHHSVRYCSPYCFFVFGGFSATSLIVFDTVQVQISVRCRHTDPYCYVLLSARFSKHSVGRDNSMVSDARGARFRGGPKPWALPFAALFVRD